MKWRNKNVFVTGAAGLLGPWLIEELDRKGARVTGLLRDTVHDSLFYRKKLDKKTTVVSGDICDQASMQRILNEYNIDVVFHLAAQPIVGYANRSPVSTFESNIKGTWSLLEACRLSPWVKKIVVASSDKAYGDQETLPYNEDMPLAGKHPYDVSKSCTDLITQSYYHTYKLPVCITRCGNFFGGGDLHFNRIIPGTIQSIVKNSAPIIRSDGSLIRDYIYVKDVVHAYMTLAEKMDDAGLHGHAFNFSTDKPYSVKEIVFLVLKNAGRSDLEPVVLNQADNEILAQHLSSAKAREMLAWEPKYGVEQGLRETIKWYESYLNAYQAEQIAVDDSGKRATL